MVLGAGGATKSPGNDEFPTSFPFSDVTAEGDT